MSLESVWTEVCQVRLPGAADTNSPADEDDDSCIQTQASTSSRDRSEEFGPEADDEDEDFYVQIRAASTIVSSQLPSAGLSSTQTQILMAASRGAKRLDPAQNSNARQSCQSWVQWYPVNGLWHTHCDVSTVFLHGEHRGQSVQGLTEKLLRGEATPEQLPPLIAVQHQGGVWVVYGNRRLKALKEYAARTSKAEEILAGVVVYDLGNNDMVRLFAKFVLAATTRDARSPPPFRTGWNGRLNRETQLEQHSPAFGRDSRWRDSWWEESGWQGWSWQGSTGDSQWRSGEWKDSKW